MGRILKGAAYIDRTFTSEKSGFGKNVCMERENLGGSTVVFHPGGRAVVDMTMLRVRRCMWGDHRRRQ
jgi:hypothetical protein